MSESSFTIDTISSPSASWKEGEEIAHESAIDRYLATGGEPFCVNDHLSFEIAQEYALWLQKEEEMWPVEYLANPCQFIQHEDEPYKYYCPNYEERKCGVCGKNPEKLYLRTSITTTTIREEREYSSVCELVCISHIYASSSHPFQSACSYGDIPVPTIRNYTKYGKPVEKSEVVEILYYNIQIEWSPRIHRFFPLWVKKNIETVLLVAQRNEWNLPNEIMWMILSIAV